MGIYNVSYITPQPKNVEKIGEASKVNLTKTSIRTTSQNYKSSNQFSPVLKDEQQKLEYEEQKSENGHEYTRPWQVDPKYPDTHVLKCCTNPEHCDYTDPNNPKACRAKVQASRSINQAQLTCQHIWFKIKPSGQRVSDRIWEEYECKRCKLQIKLYDPLKQIQLLKEYIKEQEERMNPDLASTQASRTIFELKLQLKKDSNIKL